MRWSGRVSAVPPGSLLSILSPEAHVGSSLFPHSEIRDSKPTSYMY